MGEIKIDWIGDIPKRWSLRKIGQMYIERREKVNDIDYPPLSVTMKGILPQVEGVAKTDAHNERKLVRKGDFAINSRSDRRGACGIAVQDGSVSLINIVLEPREGMNPSYLNWLFHTSMFADEFYRNGQGIVDDMWTTKWSDMKRIYIPFPPLSEQSRIASFLDDRCAKIDEAIKRCKDMNGKLDEYRKAVITKAVTKGVRGEREMKESDALWIDKIPKEWFTPRVKDHFRIISGSGFKDELQGKIDEECPICKASDISNAGQYMSKAANSLSFTEARSCGFSIIPSGSILFPKIGEAMKKNNRTIAAVDCGVDNNCQGLVPVNISSQYSYYLLSIIDMSWFDNAGTIPCLNNQKLRNFRIPLPSSSEQTLIATFLDKRCAEIDSAKEKNEAIVKKLEEYKKSLIYHAVTGKSEC